MWFKNLKIYRFSKPFTIDNDTLEKQLQEHAFHPCTRLQPSSCGWVSPLGNRGSMLTHTIGQSIMVCARQEDKILPAAVINELLEEKLDAVEADTGRRPVGKHKQSIKDELILELLPKAFSKSKRTYAYMDLQAQLLIVDAASGNKADELIQLLRKALGSLPVIPLKTATLPIGHADGIGRQYGKGRGIVYIRGKAIPIIGNVCMDMTMVDVSGLECQEGDEVIFFGEGHSAETMAHRAGTISYELLTGISRRVPRIILE